jgi:crossover junction endodeoxyribonuclease RusA
MMLTLPYPPSANRYWRYERNRVHRSKEADLYRSSVARQCEQHRIAPHTGAIKVTLHLYRPQKSGDVDNFAKIALDSLKGYLYNDDSQIVELHAYRLDDKTNPRVEVECRPVTERPLPEWVTA